jgi:hypothetical protein
MFRSALKFMAVVVLCSLVAQAGFIAPVRAEITQDPPEKALANMMEAIKAKSYPDFLVDADDQFRAALSQQNFDGVSGQLAPRLKAGYKTKFLGKLRKQGGTVHVWKLEFSDAKDEALVLMTVMNKKIAGFFVQ